MILPIVFPVALFVIGFADVDGDAGHSANCLEAILFNCVAN